MSENQETENQEAESLPFENPSADAMEATDKAFADISNENTEPQSELSELDLLKKEVGEKSDQLLRAAAEVENVRKRGRRDVEEARKFGTTFLLTDLMTVLENLNRAVEAAESSEEKSGLLAGVKMVSGQLDEILEKHHCKKIEALGQPFDPNMHEAIQMQPSDEYEANHVSMEARTGYKLHDRVLRTSQVFVSTGKP